MERIYHPFWVWEDHKAGFYNNSSGSDKKKHLESCVEMFNSESLTREYMLKVVEDWKYSCEHNLSNDSMNKIAYIGQAACCIYCGAPNTVTMESWSLLSLEVKERSNNIAKEILEHWYQINKIVQLCLNLD